MYGCLTVFWGVARKNLAKIVISIVFLLTVRVRALWNGHLPVQVMNLLRILVEIWADGTGVIQEDIFSAVQKVIMPDNSLQFERYFKKILLLLKKKLS